MNKRPRRLWWSSYAIEANKQVFKIYIPTLSVITRESNGKYILTCVLNLPTFMTLRNSKV